MYACVCVCVCRLEFLRLQGEQYSEHIVFMERFHRLRPSDVKKEWVAQAMTVNARTHTLALRHTDQPNSEVRHSTHTHTHTYRPAHTGLHTPLPNRFQTS